jgi:Thermolysin metallopeptidase, alpha-helical domain/Thrombospondin type 3 repeat
MKCHHRRLSRIGPVLGILLVAGCVGEPTVGTVVREEAADPFTEPLAAVSRASREPISYRFDEGLLVALTGRIRVEGTTPVDRARRFVVANAGLYTRTRGAVPSLAVRRSTVQPLRDRTIDIVVLRQQIDGVDVHAAELSVMLEGSDVIAVGGVLLPEPLQVSTRPTLDLAAARARLRSLGVTGEPIARPRLVIYDARVFGRAGRGERSHLVWQIATERELILLDAHDGTPVLRDARERRISLQVYDEGASPTQRYDSNDGGCQVSSCAGQVNNAVNNMASAYNFYKNGHSWIGYDGDDADHETYVNWAGSTAYQSSIDEEFHFQTGWATADIVGHEFTHGVIEHRSDLEYQFESGALNESFADLMGNIIQSENFPTALVGEGIPGGAIRDMCNPAAFGQPASYASYNPPASANSGNDYAGVHTYSGIPNFAWCKTAQLLHAKGNSNATARNKMDDVAWLLMGGLPAEATMYITASFAMTNMQNLFGGIGSNPWGHACLVWDAWNQVGVTVNGPLTGQCSAVVDTDFDGVGANNDNCPNVANPSQADADGDGVGNACDNDDDNDGASDTTDNCNGIANPGQEDADGDGIGDACEDKDHDGVDNNVDNCEDIANPGQEDADQDFYGDACEADNDNDGVIDDNDNCQFVPGGGADGDGDGLGDVCDPCPLHPDVVIAWTAGLHNTNPPINIPPQPILADSDNDGTPDGCDTTPSGFRLNGRIADAMSTIAPGAKALVEGKTTMASPVAIAINPCRLRDCVAYQEFVPVWIKVTGAPRDAVSIAVADDRGRLVTRMAGDGTLSFAPRGGRTYQLQIRTTTGKDVALTTTVEVGGGEP